MKKYKLKSKSSAKKRFKVTGTGKIKRRKAGMRHLLEHKSTNKKRNKRQDSQITKADIDKVKRLLPGVV